MAGIYIHIPFCKRKCGYCNFFSVATLKYKNELIDAVLKEVESRRNFFQGETVDTVYFGGGTPSLVNFDDVERIIEYISHFYATGDNVEITLEINPDDITPQMVSKWKKSPVNRFSIGVQSFFDDDLKYLGRIHSAGQARKGVSLILDAGFQNVSIDLIYGIPGLTDEKWIENIDRFIEYRIPHLSAYALTVEEGTPLEKMIKKGKSKNVDEELAISHFNILMDKMESSGFIHYEISNFAKNGYLSKHNTSYWQNKKYLGLGPSAHSYNGKSRQWNVSSIKKYIEGINGSGKIRETEVLTPEQKYNEYVMLSLRTVSGIDVEYIRKNFGDRFQRCYFQEVRRFVKQKYICNEGRKFFLTRKGKLFADGIAAALFI